MIQALAQGDLDGPFLRQARDVRLEAIQGLELLLGQLQSGLHREAQEELEVVQAVLQGTARDDQAVLGVQLVLSRLVDLDVGQQPRLGKGLVALAQLLEVAVVELFVLDRLDLPQHSEVAAGGIEGEGPAEALEATRLVEHVALGLGERLAHDLATVPAQDRLSDVQRQGRERSPGIAARNVTGEVEADARQHRRAGHEDLVEDQGPVSLGTRLPEGRAVVGEEGAELTDLLHREVELG